MDKAYNPASEEQIYKLWEESGAFTPTIDKSKKPFTIILPPPNANDPLHAGHALYAVEDIMIRYHRMLGDPTLWLPGTDHAGIETQFVFEKKLQKEGKSRFDYDRETLFKLIFDYVNQNRDVAKNQLKRLGFSLDWTRERFTMDENHNERVFAVFRKMVSEGLVYRDEKIVNYCTFCGTAFSNLEINHKNVDSFLWYLKYSIIGEKDKYITVATTRPETMLGDTAVAVNPNDDRYKNLKGKKLLLPLVNKEIPIIFDEAIDPKFGTGAVKVTPSHSPEDYDMGKTHNLEFVRIIDFNGKFNNNVPEKYHGFYASQVREMIVKDMEALGLLEKTEKYSHEVGHCYKCGRPIEPLTSPQWFMRMKTLAEKAVEVVKNDKIKIFPKRFKKQYLNWMEDVRDWNISRQIVWGHRIPVWYCIENNPTKFVLTFIDKNKKIINGNWLQLCDHGYSYEEIKTGLQSLIAEKDVKYYLSEEEAKKDGFFVLQETDTFDTWFSSGQWPYSTLGWDPSGNHSKDFLYFYPTTVLDTMWDILFFWVGRMIMFGIYATGQIPFKVVHMHSRVVDSKGQKMSKSKGNVINPLDVCQNFGADALRMALVIGVAPGSDIALSDDKIRAQRNFVNKIWNASRFVQMLIDKFGELKSPFKSKGDLEGFKNKENLKQEDKEILDKLKNIIKSTTKNIDNYRFGNASEDLYQFFWKDFCDIYIETAKDRGEDVIPVLLEVLFTSLKLLHPFIPFVTETVYQNFLEKYPTIEGDRMLITSQWPK